jgi:flagellar motor switch protein FliM
MDFKMVNSSWGVFNQTSGDSATPGDENQVHVNGGRYDFKRPNKFSKDHLRTLMIINENFAKTASSFLAGYLRSSGEIKLSSVEQSTYQEFMATINPPALLTMYQMSPLAGSAVLVLGHNFTAPALDLLFGGTGRRSNLAKPLTEIETRVLKKLVEKLLDEMAGAWSRFYEFSPLIETVESNAQYYKKASSMNEIVAVITFAASLADNQSEIHVCLPHTIMKEAMININAQNWLNSQQTSSEVNNDNIVDCLARVPVELAACCGQTMLSVQEFLQLEEGDVVLINTAVGDDMEVLVEGQPKFKAQTGTIGNQIAVMITEKM